MDFSLIYLKAFILQGSIDYISGTNTRALEKMFGSSRASMLLGNDLARKVLKAKATTTSALNVAPNSLATAEASTIWQEQDQLQILMEKRHLHILIVALLPHLLHQLLENLFHLNMLCIESYVPSTLFWLQTWLT